MTRGVSTRRWRRGGQILLAATLLAATLGVLVLVATNAVLFGRMTGDIATAQRRSSDLSNTEREALRMLVEVAGADADVDLAVIDVQRGLLLRQLEISAAAFPAGSRERGHLRGIASDLRRFDWAGMSRPDPEGAAARRSAKQRVTENERRLRRLYQQQENFFYTATLASVEAKRRSQGATAALVGMVVVLGVSGSISLTRRTRNDVAQAYEALKAEVVERRALEDALVHRAHHDPLTGLPNRVLLLKRLEAALAQPPAGQDGVSVLLIDLDGFKHVNDTLGHRAGDELLRRAAERLGRCVLESDTPARLGGDEFAVVVAGRRREDALAVSRRIVDVLARPIAVTGLEVSISASIGIAHRDAAESAEDLLRDADIAMYAAKSAGKGRYEVFEPGMRTRAAQRTALQQQLARAVEAGEIEVHYQPIVDLLTLRPIGMEALARWRRSDGSTVPPDVFVPVAEESGAIAGIGREVLQQACRAARRWRETVPGQQDLGLAVNVSVHQVRSGHLPDHVAEALRDSGLPAAALTLEITESMLLEDSQQVTDEFARLHALGVRIAVDDFGSGYSSLGFLLGLDADCLKIDRTLLDFDTTRSGSLVHAIGDLGRTLGLTVVAEGVETGEHLQRAREALCDAVQGYYFSPPVPEGDVPGLLSDLLSGLLTGGRPDAPPAGARDRALAGVPRREG